MSAHRIDIDVGSPFTDVGARRPDVVLRPGDRARVLPGGDVLVDVAPLL